MEFDYNSIKEHAKQDKVSVKDYLALTPSNDPFYVGSKGQLEKARWFAKIYEKMGRPQQCHIRRAHYWLVSQKPKYKKPNGEDYLNTENDWSFLGIASKYSRYAGLIPIENMIDRRNPPPIVNAFHWSDELPSETKGDIDADEIIGSVAFKFDCFNPHNTQPYLIEIFCEKSTMNDVLEPLALKYGFNLVTGLGELSITAVNNLIKRICKARKPVRIFYISDFDPAGECMPISVARKIEYFMRQEDIHQNVKLKQIMLTKEQCLRYELPRTPIKPTEKRKEGFEERHGTGATELDALESLHSGEMKRIITKEILKYFDEDAWDEVIETNRELRNEVSEFLKDKIGNVLEKLDVSKYDKFEPDKGEEIDDSSDNWIYDSELDYFEQIDSYKDFKGKGE